MREYAELVRTMATSALVHLIETRGTVGPDHKDVIADELTARGVTFNRPARPVAQGAPRCHCDAVDTAYRDLDPERVTCVECLKRVAYGIVG